MYTQTRVQPQRSAELKFTYDCQTNEIVKVLVYELNKLRKLNRQKWLYRSKLGDSVASSLHDRGIKSTDSCYSQVVEEFGLMSSESEFFTFEQKIPWSQCQGLKDNFKSIFLEKAQHGLKLKLAASNVYTHISLALRQSGIENDVYQVGVLLFKANVTIEKVFESCHNEGAVISGKVLDPVMKPCMVVLNRDSGRDMCVVGPNRIYFDATNGDDYKVHVPEGYLRKNRHPILGVAQPLIEVFCTLNSNRDCQLANTLDKYGLQDDIDQNTEPLQLIGQGVELGLRTFLMPAEDFKVLSVKVEEALSPQTNLLQEAQGGAKSGSSTSRATGRVPASLHNRLANNTRSRQPTAPAVNQPPQIRKTNAQIKREQVAAFKKAQPPAQLNETAGFGPSNVNVNHFQQPRNTLNSTFAPTPISNFTPSQRRSHTGLDQMQQAMNRVSLTPTRQSQAPQFNWNKGSNSQQKPQFNFQKPATTTMINTMAPRQPAFQPVVQAPQQPAFQSYVNPFHGNKQIPQFQPQPQSNTAFKLNQSMTCTTKPGSFLTSKNKIQESYPAQNQFAQQPMSSTMWKPAPVMVQQATQQVDMVGPEPLANFNPTPLPVRYAVNGTQSKRFDSKRSHQDTGLLPLQVQHELQQAQIEFGQLAESDQHFLQNCLRELADFGGDAEELKSAEILMLGNPVSFYQLYQNAITVAKQHELAKSLGSKEKPVEKEDKPMITVQDFGEIHLFLINFAEKLMKCSKYIDTPKSTKAILQAVADQDNEMTATQGLLEIILGSPLPRNDSLVKMYGSKSVPNDLIFLLRDQKLKCHQFVFQQNSQFMREAMKKNQQMNVQQFGQQMSTMTFQLPDWMDLTALQNYVRFSYTTEFKMTQTSQSAKRKDRPHEALELFRLACYFYCGSLQECLVAREIIPNMNAYSAILFLTELFLRETKSPCKRESSERVTAFLSDFCMFYLAKNLPVILRQEQQSLLGLPKSAIYQLVQESLYYIVDARADIEIVLTYAAKIFTEGDVFRLFQFVHQRMTKCCGFDQQHVAEMSQIGEIDPKQVYSLEIIEGFSYSSLRHEKKKVRDSFALDSGTAEPNASPKGPFAMEPKRPNNEISFSNVPNRGPSENVFLFQDGQADTQPIIDPDFELTMDLTEAETAVHLGKDKPGLTLISQAFDVARRSWSLKVDIVKPSNEISIWLVERGAPCNEINALQILRRALPIKFTSQFLELEIDDPGVKNRKSVIFYSFCHDQHQVIGHQNFANLDQLANKDKIKIRVKVREHVIHSAMVQYLATTFQRRFKEECALQQTQKMCPMTVKESAGLFSQPTYVVYWILSSDLLKVEDENTVLSFIFHYTNILRERSGQVEAVLAADQLAKCLRFNYVDFYNLMSAIRKNSSLQASPVLNDSFMREQGERLKLNKKSISKMLASFVQRQDDAKPISELHFCAGPRKYYNLQKIEGQARQKLLNSSKDASLTMAEEFISWAFHSKIQEIDTAQSKLTPYQLQYQVSEQVQSANRNINNQLVEERIRANRLANELHEMKLKYEQEVNRQRSHQQYQPTTSSTYAPMRHESPPKYVPRSLAGMHQQPDVKENVPPPKVSVQQQQAPTAAQPTPLYMQPKPEPVVKRDPPAGVLGPVQRRQPPSSLMNKSLGNRTFHSDNLLQNSFAKDNDLTKPKGGPNTLNLSTFTNPGTKRQPPGSLAGGGAPNLSMDLSAVMNKLNESPAPTLRRRPTKANANAFIASNNGSKGENCAIF